MERLVPAFILDQYAAGKRSGHFSGAALFVDLSGYSTITDALLQHGQHGAEVLATAMRAVFDPLVRAVYEQGGFISGFAGDGFMALFGGDEVSSARDALAAAWRVDQVMAARPRYETPYGPFALSVKSGLALGEVAWGIISARGRQRATYYFQGSAVDGAAAAEKMAGAGEIILGRDLGDAVRALVQTEAVGEHERLVAVTGPLPPARSYEPPPLDPDLLDLFLEPGVARQRSSGEFRQVVNVVISLPTVRTAGQLEIFTQTLFDLQEQYGGMLNQLDFGDKGAHVVLFWGAPLAHENDAERALNFLLDLQTQTAIPVNAGVTSRIAHAGCIGGEWHSEYTCYGRGINLAARFMTTAPRGEIWVDEHVVRRVAGRFEFAFEGEHPFKGFAQPQKVYALLEQIETVETFYEGVLVGREGELAQLARFVAPLSRDEYAGLLVVWGEAGIGKSRLLHAFRTSAQQEEAGFLWAVCQTDEILRHSLNPFRYWLRRYFGISASLAEARNKRSFNRKLDELVAASGDTALANELDFARSFLGALVGLHWPDSLYEQVDAQARYENTQTALTTLLRAESRRRPVILLLEDVHWLDEDSRVFLPRLLQALRSGEGAGGRPYPVAVLATARLEGTGLSRENLDYEEIFLGQLDELTLARQVAALLDGPASRSLLALIAARAEGNPFFAEQMVRYLREEGMLAETAQGWDVVGQERAPLPGDVRAVLVARLDRLAQRVREVVETASVLGREFELRLLARMLPEEGALRDDVEAAEHAAIWSGLGDLRYLFKHALLRDTAYRTQVRARRQELHARAVAALESLFPGVPQARFGELAYHCERGLLVDKARRYLHLAGDAARAEYQNGQALDYYGRALALTPDGDRAARYELHLAREAILRLLGRQEEREEALLALEALAAELGETRKQAVVALRRAIQAQDAADFARSAALNEEAIRLARVAGASDVLLEARENQASSLIWQGQSERAAQLAAEGRKLADATGDRRAEAGFLNLLGMISMEQEAHDAAGAYFTASLACARAIGDRRMQALPLNNLGKLAGEQGDFVAAQDYYEQALVIAREIGERTGEGRILVNLGWVASSRGDHAGARAYYSQALHINREVGDRLSETYNLINLSACAGAEFADSDAGQYAQQALDLARAIGEPSAEAWALTYLGHCRLATGDVDGATVAYDAALALRRELEQSVLATEPAAGLAAVHLARADVAAAQAALAGVLPLLDGNPLEGTDDPIRVYHTAYRVLDAAGDPGAATLLEQAHTILQARALRLKDAAMREAFLTGNPSHRALRAAWQRARAEGKND